MIISRRKRFGMFGILVASLWLMAQAGCGDEPEVSTGAGGMGGAGGTAGPGGAGGQGGQPEDLGIWPNSQSAAISDPWIAAHHSEIREMHPRVLALNFVNGRTNADMEALLSQIFAALAEGSRYHGYSDPLAKAFLRYEIGKSVDLTDKNPPQGYPYKNSTLYPRKPAGSPDYWKFDYKALFSEAFAALYGVPDPNNPGTMLGLCELLERGIVHEVWVYGDADVPDVNAAEVLENKQMYDEQGQKKTGQFDPCAGNGCWDAGDVPACSVSARVLWVNNTRGPGCAIHSFGHGIEWTAAVSSSNPVPAFRKSFPLFANMDFATRFQVPFNDWYGACSTDDCLTYLGPNAVTWKMGNGQTGTFDPFDQGCGNVHFPPNARKHYDDQNSYAVLSRCEHFGLGDAGGGKDKQELYTNMKSAMYDGLAPDCGGGWLVYWYQSFPGLNNPAKLPDGMAIPNWWPYLFY